MAVTLDGETVLYPILGDPIRYVKSPERLTAEFARRGHNGICVPMLVVDGGLERVVLGLAAARNVGGLLITMPHKRTMVDLCATLSPAAKLLGAVSVVRRNADGSWHGDMLDGAAFVAAMLKAGATLQGARVLQVGVGGAGAAITVALLHAGVRELVLHDGDASRLDDTVRLLRRLELGDVAVGSPDPAGCDAVVNATPMGMSAGDPLPVDVHSLTTSIFVGDVIAGHGTTPLLQAAEALGCGTVDGSAMVDAGVQLMPDFFLYV